MLPTSPRSISLAGLARNGGEPWAGGPREAIRWAAICGYRWVQLDAGTLRARELDRSARRDIAATLRREGLQLSGIDLWVPPAHLVSPAEQGRACEALLGAAELLSELAALLPGSGTVVSTALHAATPAELVRELSMGFERVGVLLADHAWPARLSIAPLGVGIDPAAIILAKGEVVGELSRLTSAPIAARLSDFAASSRVPPGEGALELEAYDAVLHTRGYAEARVVDLRGLREQDTVARQLALRE
ncbi:MAG: hypothetical protein WC718_03590 [Phycisphaerales bacterium]|jgi:hypothetical protein